MEDTFNKGVTELYFHSCNSIIPETTERVFNKQYIEQQNKIIIQQKKELQQQQELIREQKELLKRQASLLNISTEAIFAWDLNGGIVYWNIGAEQMYGYSSEEVIGRISHDLLKTVYLRNINDIKPILERDKVWNGEIEHTRKDGEKIFIETKYQVILNELGQQIVLETNRDITEHKKMEEELKIQKKQLEAIINNIYEEIYIVHNNGDYILLNEAVKKRTCHSKIEKKYEAYNMYEYYDLSGNKLSKNDVPITKLMNGESFRNNRIIEYNPHKRYLSINAKPIFDDKRNFIMGVMSFRDITNHILYKESIELQLEMLNKLINNLDLPVIRLYYPDLTIKDINQKKYNILKSTKPEIKSVNDIIGKKYSDVIIDTDGGNDIFNCIHKQIKEKKTSYIKHQKWVVLGQEMFVTTLFQPIFGKNGDIAELIGVSFDITSEVKANTQMQKTLKMQEEFFANISHELKTPLNVIYATIQLFNIYFKNGSLEEKKDFVIKYISTITQNCHRLSKLINNIVDISKIEAGFYELNLSNNNIVEVVEDIVMSVTDYTTSKGLDIIFDTDEEEKIIACDPEKIERIILNLISNAIKFTEKGGKICVDIRDKDKFVEISVCDNGIGIDSNHLNLIFDRFKQVDKSLSRNAEGTGIGLSLVKSIVELHGGIIHAESKFGKGSKFTVMLPARKVTKENMLYSSKMRNKNESTKVELSDINS